MNSKILYDIRDYKIIRCQPEPKGSAGLPSIEALFKSARIPEGEKQHYNTITVDREYLTNQAQKELRIVGSGEIKAINKPNISLNINKVDKYNFEIIINITNTIESDNFDKVIVDIEGIDIPIAITNNQGTQSINLAESGEYTIRVDDNRFMNDVSVKVVV